MGQDCRDVQKLGRPVTALFASIRTRVISSISRAQMNLVDFRSKFATIACGQLRQFVGFARRSIFWTPAAPCRRAMETQTSACLQTASGK